MIIAVIIKSLGCHCLSVTDLCYRKWEILHQINSFTENGSSETEGEESQKETEEEEESDEGKEKDFSANEITADNTDTTNSHHHHHHHTHHEHQQHTGVEGGEGVKEGGTKSPTVQRILDLLNEMEASSQVEHSGLQKFHPCPLCSGKLITV